MSEKIYPEWVQKQRTKGTTVKKVGNNYYLYQHTSKRVPEKKYPVPVDTYIGKITPNGIEKSGSKKVSAKDTEVTVKEYGFSRTVELLCPAGWKEPLGKDWRKVLDFIIVRESPESYIAQIREIPESLDAHIQLGAQKTALQRRMKKEYGVELKDLRPLQTVYLVRIAEKSFLSKLTAEQKQLLERMNLTLEVE